jgi:hypothetical protein
MNCTVTDINYERVIDISSHAQVLMDGYRSLVSALC